MPVNCYPVNMLDQRKCYGKKFIRKISKFLILFIIFWFLNLDSVEIMLTKGTLPKLRQFSSRFSDPNGSYWGMQTVSKQESDFRGKSYQETF